VHDREKKTPCLPQEWSPPGAKGLADKSPIVVIYNRRRITFSFLDQVKYCPSSCQRQRMFDECTRSGSGVEGGGGQTQLASARAQNQGIYCLARDKTPASKRGGACRDGAEGPRCIADDLNAHFTERKRDEREKVK